MKNFILITFITIIVIGLILLSGLSLIAGTGEPQKEGWEEAFSQFLQSKVTFQKLDNFNVIPQLALEISGLNAIPNTGGGELHAEKVSLKFNTIDILFKQGRLLNLEIKNLRIHPGFFSNYPAKYEYAKIIPKSNENPAHFEAKGFYNDLPFLLNIGIMETESSPPTYQLGISNSITMSIGKISITGDFIPYDINKFIFQNLQVKKGEKTCELPTKNRFSLDTFRDQILPKIIEDVQTNKLNLDICETFKANSV